MEWIERKAERYTPNRAIVFLILYSAYGGIGMCQIARYLSVHDGFYLYAGIFNLLLSCAAVAFFVSVLQVVIRRRIASSQSDLPSQPPVTTPQHTL
jgi:hypothetical protein